MVLKKDINEFKKERLGRGGRILEMKEEVKRKTEKMNRVYLNRRSLLVQSD